jgi:hypothetical protein
MFSFQYVRMCISVTRLYACMRAWAHAQELRGLNLRANYTDRATAPCRQS